MKSNNLSLLPESERRLIELDRQAALLINNMKKRIITRSQVETQLNRLPESEKEYFKEALNKYKAVK